MIDSFYLYICASAFVAMFAGSLIGIFAARALPDHHLAPESATVVKLAAAIVVSLTSLVLALMLSSANSSFSGNAAIVKKLGSDFIHLDHLLRRTGRRRTRRARSCGPMRPRRTRNCFPTRPCQRLPTGRAPIFWTPFSRLS